MTRICNSLSVLAWLFKHSCHGVPTRRELLQSCHEPKPDQCSGHSPKAAARTLTARNILVASTAADGRLLYSLGRRLLGGSEVLGQDEPELVLLLGGDVLLAGHEGELHASGGGGEDGAARDGLVHGAQDGRSDVLRERRVRVEGLDDLLDRNGSQ